LPLHPSLAIEQRVILEKKKMLRTVEAVMDEQGEIQLLETLELAKKKYRVLVTVLEELVPSLPALRPFGLGQGEFSVPDSFDEPLPEMILAEFEGHEDFAGHPNLPLVYQW